jgi:hypothetical protein
VHPPSGRQFDVVRSWDRVDGDALGLGPAISRVNALDQKVKMLRAARRPREDREHQPGVGEAPAGVVVERTLPMTLADELEADDLPIELGA